MVVAVLVQQALLGLHPAGVSRTFDQQDWVATNDLLEYCTAPRSRYVVPQHCVAGCGAAKSVVADSKLKHCHWQTPQMAEPISKLLASWQANLDWGWMHWGREHVQPVPRKDLPLPVVLLQEDRVWE